MDGSGPPKGCTFSSVNLGGLPFKRELSNGTIIEESTIERFGYGDEKLIAKMRSQINAGEKMDGLWTHLRN